MYTLHNSVIIANIVTSAKSDIGALLTKLFDSTCFYIHFFWHTDLWHFITRIGLCNHTHSQDSELFCPHKETPWGSPFIVTPCTIPSPWQPSLKFCHINDDRSVTKSLWQNYNKRVLNKVNIHNSCGWLFFTQHNILEIHPSCCLDQQSISFHCWVLFCCMDLKPFAWSFSCWRMGGWLPLIGYYT